MCTDRAPRRRLAGLTLVELIIFMVVIGVGIVGILAVLNFVSRTSADPIIRKNMLAIAESLLEEARLMPFTYCDPTDPNAATATSAAVGAGPNFCSATVESLGPEGGEARTSAGSPFNNVNDYYVGGGLVLASPISDISGTYFAPAGYSAILQIVAENLNDIASTSAPATMEALRIAVTVSRGGDSVTLEGYRTRHSPNMVP